MADRLNTSTAFRRWAFLSYWVLIFIATHVPRLGGLASGWLFGIPHFDKVVHFGMFAGWMGLSFWLLRTCYERPRKAAVAGLFVAGALYAAFDELSQPLVGRDTSLADFCADIGGLTVAWLLIALSQRRPAQPRPA
jgi:hypothetical protein